MAAHGNEDSLEISVEISASIMNVGVVVFALPLCRGIYCQPCDECTEVVVRLQGRLLHTSMYVLEAQLSHAITSSHSHSTEIIPSAVVADEFMTSCGSADTYLEDHNLGTSSSAEHIECHSINISCAANILQPLSIIPDCPKQMVFFFRSFLTCTLRL